MADIRSQADDGAKPEPLPQGTATKAVGFIGNPARSEADAELRAVFMEAKAMTVRVGNDLAGWRDPADDMGFAVNTVRKIEWQAECTLPVGAPSYSRTGWRTAPRTI